MRQGWRDPAPARLLDDYEDRLDRIDQRGTPKPETFSDFMVTIDTRTWGAQIAVQMWSLHGLDSIVILRNFSRDPGSTTVIHSWACSALRQTPEVFPIKLTYADGDGALAGNVAYYWIKGVPAARAGAAILIGPQTFDASADSETSLEVLDFDASLSASVAGVASTSVSVRISPGSDAGSIKIYISGYQGIGAFVAIAQSENSPFKFNLRATGEDVVLRAIAVSKGGIESSTGPTKNLTLSAAATVPAKIMKVAAAELPGAGVQITWRAGAESNVTAFLIRRGFIGGGIGPAATIASIVPDGSLEYVFLDVAGLSGSFEWYVIARNAIGDSAASEPATCLAISTSANLPPNPAGNSTNDATVDSVDGGGFAIVRIYGPGGVGSSWTRTTGFGTIIIPSGAITGQPYLTDLWVVYDGGSYRLLPDYKAAMPDEYLWAGKIRTTGPSTAVNIAASPTGASRNSNVTTITCTAAHGGTAGQTAVIAGVIPVGSVGIADMGVPGASRDANVVVLQTVAQHSILAGQVIVVGGVVPASFNGTFVVLTAPTPTSLSFAQTGPNQSGGDGKLGVTFNGDFLIASAPSITMLTYAKNGPDDSGGLGTVLISGGGATGGGMGSGGDTGHDGGHYLTY